MVIEFSKVLFEEKISNNNFVIVYFYASWCGPCVNFKPVYENVSSLIKDVVFGKINVDEQRDLAIKYGVSSIPTVILLKNKEPVWHNTGSMSEDELKKQILLFTK